MISTRYFFLLGIQVFLILSDLLFNGCSEFSKVQPELQLIVFVFQDVLIVLSITVMCISFFSTDIFQAGLVGFILNRFKLPLLISGIYLLLTISLHSWLLAERWENPDKFVWTSSLTTFFSIQRFFSPIFYYTTKRSMLLIAHPIYYKSNQNQ